MGPEVRRCPVPGCNRTLGTTKSGNPYLLCPAHYAKLDNTTQLRLWRAYGSWQRIERKYMGMSPPRPSALLQARAIAISSYIDVRNDCILKAAEGEPQQLEVAL